VCTNRGEKAQEGCMVQRRFKRLGVGFWSNDRREEVITIEEV
jgi:hypothetical protein